MTGYQRRREAKMISAAGFPIDFVENDAHMGYYDARMLALTELMPNAVIILYSQVPIVCSARDWPESMFHFFTRVNAPQVVSGRTS